MFFWIATGIFIVSFGLIISERLDKTKVALIGAGLVMALNIVTQNEAFYDRKYAIDYSLYSASFE
jgi:Na+/H+ antiporter NhaD/arsenite permease-like protein